ncbi:MAG TPA: hypothetical protein VJ385_03565 [Fibrobacteria bacterium]|nr:hypothetical protein [Fibrobacteria bacterium]
MEYLLIETRSAWEGGDVHGFLELAVELARQGNRVDLFLLQNGVLLARKGADARMGDLAHAADVSLWADAFSLEQRSVSAPALHEAVRVGGMADLIRMLARPGCKPIWHS